MRRHQRGFTISGMMVASLLLLITFGVAFIALERYLPASPPVVFHGARMDRSAAVEGSTVWVEVTRTRHRYCPGEVAMFWKSENGDHVVQQASLPAAPDDKLGLQVSSFRKRVPQGSASKAKRWCYEPTLLYHCTNRTYAVTQPPACLTVLSRGEEE